MTARDAWLVLACVTCMPLFAGTTAGNDALAAETRAADSDTAHDGARDFDFKLGRWKTRIVRHVDPLSGSAATIELRGTVVFRKVWNTGAFIEEIEADGPRGHWQALTVFLYDATSRTWSQNFANSRQGVLQPPLIGAFRGGRGELVAQDRIDGRPILVRAVWSRIRPGSHRYEEFYSTDSGQRWLPAFRAELERLSP